MRRTLNIMTCEGRHPIPKADDGGIFPMVIERPTDGEWMRKHAEKELFKMFDCDPDIGLSDSEFNEIKVNLFVTGFTPATLAIVATCVRNSIPLTCWHYDAATGDYWAQPFVDNDGEVI